MFKLFAELIAFHLDATERLNTSELNLQEERKTAELRDQFIAILGHDLRNPVGAVSNVAQLLLRMPVDERVKRLATIIQDSSFRMKGLIDNILDFASGKLGGGIILNRNNNEPLEGILTQVLTELKVIWPERTINAQFNLAEPVNCDGKRVAQLFSNLLSNALTHGQKDAPVTITAVSTKQAFILAVNNAGNKIPDEVVENLFQPFSRGEAGSSKQGLGLGLFIASEIANAHGGTLTVCSTDENTCFTLQIPA
jgi:signal transduction histidine kinase